MGITTTGKYAASLCGERGTHMAKGFGNAKPDRQSYTGLIKEILRVVEDSKNNKKKVYSLLEKNLHLLDEQFLTELKRWAKMELSQVSSTESVNIARNIGNFCVLLFEFPLREKANNLEIVIAGYEISLKIFTRSYSPKNWAIFQINLGNAHWDRIRGEKAANLEDAIRFYNAALEELKRDRFPYEWATVQINLGSAYLYRIRGEKTENLEVAIRHYNAALEELKRDKFPEYWAKIQMGLGNAYIERIRGEKAENLETAIRYHNAALQEYKRDRNPESWATVQLNLGNAYSNRIRGEKAENLEDAIRHYNAALEERKRDRFPEYWANTQMNLGVAYRNRIRGEQAENLENAIRYHNSALQEYKRDKFPEYWAKTQMNLGVAYRNRIRGEQAENLEDAIRHYNSALEKLKRDRFSEEWAKAQINLGNAYGERIRGEQAENLEDAIRHYNSALEELKRDRFPEEWAKTQMNLGNAYSYRIKGEKAKNLEAAIRYYNAALEEFTRDRFPEYWAATQMNLGNAYREYIRENKTENWQDAIQPLQASLEIFTHNSFPHKHVEAAYNLGLTYQYAQQWENASQTYKSSIDTVELLRGEIFSGTEAKQKLAEEWNDLYQRMAEVCLQLGKDQEAIEYIERSKTRNLVELLANQSQALQQVGLEIEEEKRRLAAAKEMQVQGGEENTEVTRLNQLREERNNKIDKIIPLQPISFGEIQALLDDGTAILKWYIFAECFRAFVITQDGEKPLKWESTKEDLEKLNKFSEGSLHTYNKEKSRWRFELTSRLQELATILHVDEILKLIPDNCETLILVPHRFLHLYPLHALPIANRNDLTHASRYNGGNLRNALAPQPPSLRGNGENELIPIHQEVLLDRFAGGVKYAPSSQLLKFVKKSRERQDINNQSQSFFAVQDPNDNLLYTNIEVETIERHFQPTTVLKKGDATSDALQRKPYSDSLQTAQVLHFSCHGYFNTSSPAESAIVLAGCGVSGENSSENYSYRRLANGNQIDLKKCLTLGDIFNLSLPKCRLVTLSACETGRIDVNSSDEYIGLPSGFLKAGSSSVISSLWSVDDFATTLLMIHFYDIFYDDYPNKSPSLSTAKALSQAQYWLRTSTQTQLIAWTQNHSKIDAEHRLTIIQYLQTLFKNPNAIPFKNLESWAGFCTIGD
jgi:CHAT domain-containing protein